MVFLKLFYDVVVATFVGVDWFRRSSQGKRGGRLISSWYLSACLGRLLLAGFSRIVNL